MRTIKFLLIFLCLLTYLILGYIVRVALFWVKPHTLTKALNRLTCYLMRLFTFVGGMKIAVAGEKSILKEKGLFVISQRV